MCLYPRLILNRKYKANKKNGYNPPTLKDERVKYVAIGCGQCIECREQKARAWRVRLMEELKAEKLAYFVTLSFSPQAIDELSKKYNIDDVNELAKQATRLYEERWRKKYKKTLRHWFVTELGQTNTERIHLHGILFLKSKKELNDITKKWQYGNTWIGDYCNEKTINYIIKYMLKVDEKHPDYKSIVLASKGLGKTFTDKVNMNDYAYRPSKTIEYYRLNNGQKVSLPIYYRNKIFNEETREKLWIDRIEKEEIYVRGIKFDISTDKGRKRYEAFLKRQQKTNKELHFGNPDWNLRDYKITLAMINARARENAHTHTTPR